MTFRKIGTGLGLALAMMAGAATAQDFPTKPITIVAHTGAGSSTDIFARELAKNAEPLLGQPIVIENKPGGSGAAQMGVLMKSKADGYTVAINTLSHLTAWQTNLKGVYSWDDFSWIALAQRDPYVIVVRSDSDIDSLEKLAAAGSDKMLNVGGYGAVGSAHQIAFSLWAEAAGLEFNWVPFEGGQQAMTALLGGHIDAVNTNPAPMLQFAEADRVKALGVLADDRLEALPDVPTYAEAGFEVDTGWQQVRGIYGPKDIPEDVKQTLSDAFLQAMQSEEFKAYMATTGQVAGDLGPQEYTAFIDKQMETAGRWLAQLGVIN